MKEEKISVIRKMFLVPIVLTLVFVFPAAAKQKGISAELLNNLRQKSPGLSAVYEKNQKLTEALAALPALQDGIDPKEESALARIAHSLNGSLEGIVLEGGTSDKAAYVDGMVAEGSEAVSDFYLFVMNNPDVQSNLTEKYIEYVIQRRDALIDRIGNEFSQQLAEELKKIPGVMHGYDWSVLEALDDIAFLKEISTQEYMKNLSGYFEMGLPEHRKFCTPVLFLFLLADKGEFSKTDNPLKDTGLKLFKKNFKKSVVGEKTWKDFDKSADILNAPELIEHYLKVFFSYDYDLLKQHMTTHWYSLALTPREVFRRRGGVCHDAANFACALLKRAGYEAHTFTIEPKGIGTGGVTRHTVAIYKVNGKIYKLADTNELGVIKGPFQSDEEVAKSLAGSLNALNWYYRDVRKYGW